LRAGEIRKHATPNEKRWFAAAALAVGTEARAPLGAGRRSSMTRELLAYHRLTPPLVLSVRGYSFLLFFC
jgi:hypothetical protein